MTDVSSAISTNHIAWNKGKIIGARPPLRPQHVWSIRTKLQVEGRIRDLALFNLAIDSKLRGCDLVALKVDDVAPSGYAADRATVRQRKTGRPVKMRPHNWERFSFGTWLLNAVPRLHRNKLATALANKLARIAWSILRNQTTFATSHHEAAAI